MIVAERAVHVRQQGQTRGWALDHGDGHGPVEADGRASGQLLEPQVQRCDVGPSGGWVAPTTTNQPTNQPTNQGMFPLGDVQ